MGGVTPATANRPSGRPRERRGSHDAAGPVHRRIARRRHRVAHGPGQQPGHGSIVLELAQAGIADVDRAVAAATRRAARVGAPTPGERSGALLALAAGGRARRGARPGRDRQAGKPIKLRREFDVPGIDRQRRLLRRRGPPPRGQGRRASTPATTPRTSAASRSASSARSPRGTTRCRWPLWKVLPAIAAGNTIVLKPAELTPLTSLMFAEAATRGRASRDGVVNVVTGTGRVAGEALVGAPATSPWSPSPAPPRWAGGSRSSPPAPSSGCTSSSAARRRSSSSTTPTSRPPRTARSPAR